MVLAAGFGTRMGPLTKYRPKPLLEVAARTLIDRTLDLVASAGISRAIVNLHYMGDMIRAHLAGRKVPEILFSEEQPAILDTGGGVARALPQLGPGAFFVLNTDVIWLGPNPLEVLSAAWRPGLDALMLLVPRARARAHAGQGDFKLIAEGGPLRRRGKSETAPFVYGGAQILTPAAFAGLPAGAFSLNLVWDRLIATGRLAGVTYPGVWVDVGTPPGLAEAERMLAE